MFRNKVVDKRSAKDSPKTDIQNTPLYATISKKTDRARSDRKTHESIKDSDQPTPTVVLSKKTQEWNVSGQRQVEGVDGKQLSFHTYDVKVVVYLLSLRLSKYFVITSTLTLSVSHIEYLTCCQNNCCYTVHVRKV